jgi:hypothetical protein
MLLHSSNLKNLHLPESGSDLSTIISVNHKKLQNINMELNKLKEWKIDLTSLDDRDFNMKYITEINISSTNLPVESLLAVLLCKEGQYAVTARNNSLYVRVIFLFQICFNSRYLFLPC